MSVAKVKYGVGRGCDPSRDTDIVLVFPDHPNHGEVKVYGPVDILSSFPKNASVKVSRDPEGILRTANGDLLNLELMPEPALPAPPMQAQQPSMDQQRQAMVERIDALTGWWAVCLDSAKRQLPEMTEEGQRAVATSIFIQMSQSGAFRR